LNLAGVLRERLRGSGCRALLPLRVRTTPRNFLYPDLVIICGKPRLTDEKQDTLINPKVIIEILSPSTRDYDYGGKFELYRQIPAFEEYLLVSQSEPKVEVFRKSSDDLWTLRTCRGIEAEVALESVQVTIPLREIFENVEFPAE
jgi:Uma2 family endonuclease